MALDPTITVGMIGAVGAVLAASIPYYFTKKNEIALNNQKIKLDRYDDLLQKFLLWIQTKTEDIKQRRSIVDPQTQMQQETPEARKAANDFIMAYQRASSFASKEVLKAIEDYFKIWRTPLIIRQEADEKERQEALAFHNTDLKNKINDIFRAIRKDIQKGESRKQRAYPFKSMIYPTELAEAK